MTSSSAHQFPSSPHPRTSMASPSDSHHSFDSGTGSTGSQSGTSSRRSTPDAPGVVFIFDEGYKFPDNTPHPPAANVQTAITVQDAAPVFVNAPAPSAPIPVPMGYGHAGNAQHRGNNNRVELPNRQMRHLHHLHVFAERGNRVPQNTPDNHAIQNAANQRGGVRGRGRGRGQAPGVVNPHHGDHMGGGRGQPGMHANAHHAAHHHQQHHQQAGQHQAPQNNPAQHNAGTNFYLPSPPESFQGN